MLDEPILLPPRDEDAPVEFDAPGAMMERLKAASEGLRRLNDVMVLIERVDEEARDLDRRDAGRA